MSDLTKGWPIAAAIAAMAATSWASAVSPAATISAVPRPTAEAHTAAAPAAESRSDNQKTVYEMGVLLSRGLDSFQLSESEFEALRAGLADGFQQRASAAEARAYMPKVQALQHERAAAGAQHEKEAGQAYLAKVAAASPGAQRLAGGLLYIPLAPGRGASPGTSDEVKVNYEGRLIDGTVFDSSSKRGQAANFSLTGVIPCWTEALKVMKVGGTSRIICPADLAYGDRGALPLIRPGATLEFDVELLEVHPAATHSQRGQTSSSNASADGAAAAPRTN
jgi:FKBP-type peptidyl-prolyl cis-trans isomerase FkpA